MDYEDDYDEPTEDEEAEGHSGSTKVPVRSRRTILAIKAMRRTRNTMPKPRKKGRKKGQR